MVKKIYSRPSIRVKELNVEDLLFEEASTERIHNGGLSDDGTTYSKPGIFDNSESSGSSIWDKE